MGHVIDSSEKMSSCTTNTVMVEVISHEDGDSNTKHPKTMMKPNADQSRRDHRDSNIFKKSNAPNYERLDRDLDTIELMPLDNCDSSMSFTPVMSESTTGRYSHSAYDHSNEDVSSKVKTMSSDEKHILNYYKKYSTITAKTLIDTLFLPSQKICRQCALSAHNSMVYSDRLIYRKQSLYAREIICYHVEFDTHQIFFRYSNYCSMSQSCLSTPLMQEDYMPIVSVVKTNYSGLFYQYYGKQDVFDLNQTLAPNIMLINPKNTELKSNTEIYHRLTLNMDCRLSQLSTCKPMTFHDIQRCNHGISEKRILSCDDNLQYWIDYSDETQILNSKRHNELALSATRMHQHRSSLLMLEPLLIMSDFQTPRNSLAKNRLTHSEHVKIVRMVIAYTLSFFLLAIVTFYIVYFA